MIDLICYKDLPETVKLGVGEVTVRAGQLDNVLSVAICRAGSKTLADAFASAKNVQNRETILDESKRYLRSWAESKGVDCDVDGIIARAKSAYRLRDQAIAERCFVVEGEGDAASRCHWPESPFDLHQLSEIAEEFFLIVREISAIDGSTGSRNITNEEIPDPAAPAIVAQQGQLVEPRRIRARLSPRRFLHSVLAAIPFIPPV